MSWRPDRAVTTTYMGGRRGPPDGDERPLRGLPGGRARPRPTPPSTPPDDDQPAPQGPGNGARRPGRLVPDDGGRTADGGSGGVVRPLRPPRPLRVIPGGASAPPSRVIPGGAWAPLESVAGGGQAP